MMATRTNRWRSGTGFYFTGYGSVTNEEKFMARKYSKGASKKVEKAMHERKKGTLKSGRSRKKVKSRKQAIAIGLSEARAEGKKVPKKKAKKTKKKTKKTKKKTKKS
jgi:hypothetical protein